jgi:hypothetical protein
MIQQVTITSEAQASLKPLVEAAIRRELRVVEHGIQRTRERLDAFEKQYDMTSQEFERRFGAAELKESLDFIEWWGEIKTLQLLEDQQRALENVRIA